MDSAARSGGVSRSDCRHVVKITTPYESNALIYLKLVVLCLLGMGGKRKSTHKTIAFGYRLDGDVAISRQGN